MKSRSISCVMAVILSLGLTSIVSAESQPSTIEQVKDKAGQVITKVQEQAGEIGQQLKTQAGQVINNVAATADVAKKQVQAKLNEGADVVEHSEQTKQLSAGLLQWIYVLGQALAFPAFYWLAFALMVAGVVSWAGQLVLGKLVVASAGGFSITEIISDVTVLAISLVGLVLTTQTATHNQVFTQSPLMVLSSAAVGIIFGIMLYLWGQAQEVEAAKMRDIMQNNARKGR